MATFGPWIGVPNNMQRVCAVEGCHREGVPHICPYDGARHHHGCVHYQSARDKAGLTFRPDGWGLLCWEHYALLVAAENAHGQGEVPPESKAPATPEESEAVCSACYRAKRDRRADGSSWCPHCPAARPKAEG